MTLRRTSYGSKAMLALVVFSLPWEHSYFISSLPFLTLYISSVIMSNSRPSLLFVSKQHPPPVIVLFLIRSISFHTFYV